MRSEQRAADQVHVIDLSWTSDQNLTMMMIMIMHLGFRVAKDIIEFNLGFDLISDRCELERQNLWIGAAFGFVFFL
jgi:hypothetical protein